MEFMDGGFLHARFVIERKLQIKQKSYSSPSYFLSKINLDIQRKSQTKLYNNHQYSVEINQWQNMYSNGVELNMVSVFRESRDDSLTNQPTDLQGKGSLQVRA